MYRNLELWGDTELKQDQAIVIIRNGIAKGIAVADPEINLAATLVELQKNGDQWQLIRSPKFHLAFKETSHFLSKSTVDLILRMSCENPKDRIPAEKISKFLKQEEITLLKREVQYEKNTANQLRRFVFYDSQS